MTLVAGDVVGTTVVTAAFVSAVDAVQLGLGDGPCLTAARDGRPVLSSSLEDEGRWGRFGTLAADLGVQSVVSLPLRVGNGVLGAINVYAHTRAAFDERSVELGEAFAAPAALAVQHAQVLEQTRRLAGQVQTRLARRMVVEQAVGVLMGREGLDVHHARRRLHALSEARGEPVEVLARAMVDDAARRAGGPRSLEV